MRSYHRRNSLRKRRKNPPIGTMRIPRPGRGADIKYCKAQTPSGRCGVTTRERKDYCLDHVDLHPYVAHLKRKIALSDIEELNVRKQGYQAIQPSSVIAADIIAVLKTYGKRSSARLAREVNRDSNLIERYVEYLYQQGLVELSETRRGSIIVNLAPQKRHYCRYF